MIASGGTRGVLLGVGFAAAITESISMGAVGHAAPTADLGYYRAVRQRELAVIKADPQSGRDELRVVYAANGFTGELLDQILDTLTARRNRWLATVTDDVLHLHPVETNAAVRGSVLITPATLVGHIPLLPFAAVD